MTMKSYDAKPWLALYARGTESRLIDGSGTMLDAWATTVAERPHGPAIHYFDGVLDYDQVDQFAGAFACWLADEGLSAGDRLFIALQNVPQLVIAAVAAWRIGAVPVLGNPMYREQELAKILADCTPRLMLCHHAHEAGAAAAQAAGMTLVTTAPDHFQTRDDPRVMPPSSSPPEAALDLMEIIALRLGEQPAPIELSGDDLGLLLYTSGTTGRPKGVKLTHMNLVHTARLSRGWFEIDGASRIFALAPLFHITGFELHVCLAIVCGSSMILIHRFEPNVALEAIAEHRATWTIGTATAFIAMLNAPGASAGSMASLRHIFSGGAPVPPALVEAFEARMGHRIRTAYGMTETTAPTHAAPLSGSIPRDPASGALAIGIPMHAVEARILDDAGALCPAGEAGEIVVRGPQVMQGYWNRADETADVLRDGWMHTGDIGFMDEAGWFYLVDRKKDMINASGFKVWPREVEDILYGHAAVREAGVVGVADPYRGETVRAFVSLRPDVATTPEDLVAFCRQRLAAYKVPREIRIVDELPKNPAGKIVRHALRDL
jgi:long-chain acyl-CoA synthetase